MNYYLHVLKNYALFKGRARRSEYWYFVLFNFIVTMIFVIIDQVMGSLFLNNIYSLAVLIPSLAVAVRRMHDVNKSGWFILIPFYNLYLLCIEGTKGENNYGQDPKGQSGETFAQALDGNLN
jgi:uncharacterized membrane protein YhaH (DUF805 family)